MRQKVGVGEKRRQEALTGELSITSDGESGSNGAGLRGRVAVKRIRNPGRQKSYRHRYERAR